MKSEYNQYVPGERLVMIMNNDVIYFGGLILMSVSIYYFLLWCEKSINKK